MTLKKTIKDLESKILYHKKQYYQGSPEIPDVEYDNLEAKLKELDPENFALSIVGSDITTKDKVPHKTKMLSLDKSYDVNDLWDWLKKAESIGMYKIDGVSCSLLYSNGKLIQAKTRGDGSFGEDITEKIKWIKEVPKTVEDKDDFEVRGELYCLEENFFKLCDLMPKLNLEKPTSQRNIVAGIISRKDHISLAEHISFMAFDYIKETRFNKEQDKFNELKKNLFICPEIYKIHSLEQLNELIEETKEFMENGPFQIDGLVFCYNETSYQEELGYTAHHPRYKIAFKFAGEAKETTIKEIEWSVSRNGILTPVAIVEPIELSNAMISRVTLHNYGMVKNFNLKIGDKIQVIRSGEVIPKFLSVVESKEGDVVIPSKVCGHCVKSPEVCDIRLICVNAFCPNRDLEIILNYIQKIGVDDLSSKRLQEMIDVGMVKGIADLYRIKRDELLALNKVKDKLADKILSNIEKTKKTTLPKFLSALGLTGGALNKCEKVVNAGFNTIEKIKNLTLEQLTSIESFAEKSANDFLNSIKEKHALIDELIDLGLEFETIESTVNEGHELFGKKICITGALSEKRNVIEDRLKKIGAVNVGSVSKNTDYLVTNETDPSSSKYKKAIELKIPIITEEELAQKINS